MSGNQVEPAEIVAHSGEDDVGTDHLHLEVIEKVCSDTEGEVSVMQEGRHKHAD